VDEDGARGVRRRREKCHEESRRSGSPRASCLLSHGMNPKHFFGGCEMSGT
jgi:hypothetical protein